MSTYFCYFVIKGRVHLFEQTWLLFTQGCIVPSLVEIGSVFFLILSMYFPIFGIISPWKWVWSFIWTNLNPLHPRCFVLSLVVPVVLEKKMKIEKFMDRRHTIRKAHWAVSLGELKRLHKYTEAFNWQVHANEWNAIIYPWKRAWPSNWTKLNFLYLRMLHVGVWLKLDQLFWRRTWKYEKFRWKKFYF